ncbi:MAG: diguanylate cyclase [Aquificaceae bacterium]
MSIRRRLYTNLFLSIFLTLTATVISLYLISSYLLNSKLKEVYTHIFNNYEELLKHEERNIEPFTIKTHVEDEYYYVEKLSGTSCDRSPYYKISSMGLYYGRNKAYADGCYFIGVRVEELLDIMKSLLGVEWIIYYDRNSIKDAVDLDKFVKDKIATDSILIDKFSDSKVLSLPLDVVGYRLHGSFFEKSLLMEILIVDINQSYFGKIILVKDVSGIYKEVYTTILVLFSYSMTLILLLSFALFRISSFLVSRIILLRDVAGKIEKMDFSAVDLIKRQAGNSKDEVCELGESIYHMAVSLKSTFEELQEKKKELEQMAYYDPLTGLPNRRFFFDHARILFENSKRYGTDLSVLIMDLDYFKRINDTYGHDAGDLILKSFADVIRKNTRHSDLPARFGGEEFVLLMPNTSLQQAKIVAEKIRLSFQNSHVVYKEEKIGTTLSGGLASFTSKVESIDDLIKMADEALYRAKELGRNRVEAYELKK